MGRSKKGGKTSSISAFSRPVKYINVQTAKLSCTSHLHDSIYTPAGRAFSDEMKCLLPQYDQAVRNARRVAQGEREKLVIGYIPAAMLSTLLPMAVQEFERTTAAELTLQDCSVYSSKVSRKGLSEHRLDVLLANDPGEEPGVAHECVARSSLMIALPHTYPLAQQKALSLAALAEEPWIMVPAMSLPASLMGRWMSTDRQVSRHGLCDRFLTSRLFLAWSRQG